MNRFFLIILILLSGKVSTFAQLKSGMIIQAGSGYISNVSEVPDSRLDEILKLGGSKSLNYSYSASFGYKFRIQPQAKFSFYDVDWSIGLKKINYNYQYLNPEFLSGEMQPGDSTVIGGMGSEGHNAFYYTSINPSYNYRFHKNFSGGIGLEPTLYFKDGYDEKWKFDCPLTLKMGYDLKFIGFSLNYKIGLFNILKSNEFASGNLSDIQLQLFIPF